MITTDTLAAHIVVEIRNWKLWIKSTLLLLIFALINLSEVHNVFMMDEEEKKQKEEWEEEVEGMNCVFVRFGLDGGEFWRFKFDEIWRGFCANNIEEH